MNLTEFISGFTKGIPAVGRTMIKSQIVGNICAVLDMSKIEDIHRLTEDDLGSEFKNLAIYVIDQNQILTGDDNQCYKFMDSGEKMLFLKTRKHAQHGLVTLKKNYKNIFNEDYDDR